MKPPAFQVYPKDYETDEKVKLMSLEQEGAYWRLILHQWIEGSVPADVESLARLCRIEPARMRRLWTGPLAAAFLPASDGRLANSRMERDRAMLGEYHAERAEAGRRGGIARQAKAKQRPSSALAAAKQSATAQLEAKSSPSSATASATARTDERTQQPAINPLVGDRPSRVSQALALTRDIAGICPACCRDRPEALGAFAACPCGAEAPDGAEIMATAAHYEGAHRQKVNPATMSDDRLLNTISDLKATLADLRKKQAAKGPRAVSA